MNILVIAFGKGGGARNFRFLLKTIALTFPEDHYHVVTLEKRDFDECASLSNFHVYELPVPLYREITRMNFGYFGIKKFVSETKADLVLCGYNNVYAKLPVPVVMNMSSIFMTKPWREALAHWEGNPARLAVMRFFFRQTLQYTSSVLAQTEMVRDDLKRIGIHESRIAVIPKAVEGLDDVDNRPLGDEQERLLKGHGENGVFTFLYAATYYQHKNHRVLVSAVEQLERQGIHARLALTVSRDDLEKIGGKPALELADRGLVLPLGWVEKEQMRTLYDRCDACLMPSLFESLSSAHIEAMAWEKPQVCADLSYARALCKDAAIYVDPCDPISWAEAMTRMQKEPDLRQALIRNGRNVIRRDFPKSWSEMARRVHDVFIDTLRRRSE